MNNVYSNTCANIRDFSKTCKSDNPCPEGTECCQETHENGSTGPITCCAFGSCNSKLGHCSNPRTGAVCPNLKRENYADTGKGGKGGNRGEKNNQSCHDWKYICYVLLSVIIILLIMIMRKNEKK